MVNKLTLPSKENDVQLKVNEIIDEYVDKASAQDISGRKTFLGEKAIYFKQIASSNKLGFTLYNTSSTEIGAFEYRPNTIGGGALLNVNCSYSSTAYVGFRYWGTAVNIIAPKVATAGNYYIPVKVTDGNTTVTATSAGTVNISSLLPTVNDATITITQGGVTKGSFTLNQASGDTIALDAGGSLVTTDGVTINTNTDDELQAIGVIEKNAGNVKYDWVGTSAEYTAQNVATLHPDWVCYITDDETPSNFANTELSNLSSIGRSKIPELSMPSVNYTDLTLQASGSLYTATANGYVCFSRVANVANAGTFLGVLKEGATTVSESTVKYGVSYQCNTVYDYNWLTLPVRKGDVWTATYGGTGATVAFRFIYAEGEL